jgi:hypothetical protein
MNRRKPEFLAVPLVVAGLGILFLIMWAAHAGTGAFVAVGIVGAVLLVVLVVVALRRPRGALAGAPAGFVTPATPAADDVHRVLVVVDDACSDGEAERLLAEHGGTRTSVFVVAPAVSSRIGRLTGDDTAYQQAQECLDATLHALGSAGFDTAGRVGAHDPIEAADDGLREFPADEIVFVLHREHEHAWLKDGVVDLARSRYPVPVHELLPTS